MPVIPVYQQRSFAGGSVPLERDQLGAAVSNLGQSVSAVQQQIVENQEREAALWATKQLTDAQIQWQQEIIERQENAEPGAPDFTGGVLKDYDAFTGEIISKAPTRASKQFIQQRLQAHRASIAAQSLQYEANERAANTVESAEQSIEAGRMQAFQTPQRFPELVAERNALFDSMQLDPETRRKLKETATLKIARESVRGMIDRNPMAALELLNEPQGKETNAAVAALSTDDRLKLIEVAETQVASRMLAAEEAVRAERERAASDLEIAVFRGEGTRHEIDRAFDDETISGTKRTQLHLEMDRQVAEVATEVAMRNLVDVSRGLGIPLDPGDADHRKAVEYAYTRLPGDPLTPAHNAATGALIQDTGIVPNQVRSMVRAMTTAGSVEQSVAMADLVDHIQTVSPSAISQFSADQKAFALQLQELVRAGTPPGTAVDLVRDRVFKTSEAERKLVLDRYLDQSDDNADELDNFIDDDFDTLAPFNQPEASDLMRAEFDRLTESYYLKTHEIGAARSLAWKDMKSVWGVSFVNGERVLMKYPPEQRGDYDRDDLPENATVISDQRTARDGTYGVVVIGNDGLPRIQPFRWEPNVQTPADYNSAVSDAKTKRELLKQLEYERDNAQELSRQRIQENRRIAKERIEKMKAEGRL